MAPSPTSEPSAFNLIRDSWLPLRRRSGAIERISPWEITTGVDDDPFMSFAWPRPDFNGAAHEFLIGLLTTAASPADNAAWRDWWLAPPAPEELKQRFSELAHAFDLDGPGPRFLQDFDPLEGADSKSAATLLIDAPGTQTLRNNADLFVKRGGATTLSRAAAAMALFTLSCYAPSGGAGHRTSLRGGGPMTTLIVASHPKLGDTLWGRLWPNVETRRQIANRAIGPLDSSPVFPWLLPTRTSNPKDGGRPTTPADVHPLQVYWCMPRRIRLEFQAGNSQYCELTDVKDQVVVASYRTKNYGTNYSEGFEHPLTPHYRQKPDSPKLPVHPNPGGVSYRLWPGLLVTTDDKLRDPAPVVREWSEREQYAHETRFALFGYDMDNMKARAWIEKEIPIWRFDDSDTREWCHYFVNRGTAGANTVARLLTGAVKAALHKRPKEAKGDYSFIAERFYRDTESAFQTALDDALSMIQEHPDADDPTTGARERWAPEMAEAALRLFDEYAPDYGLEERDMHRHVKARFLLGGALRGQGKAGRTLFEDDLGIPVPATTRQYARPQETA